MTRGSEEGRHRLTGPLLLVANQLSLFVQPERKKLTQHLHKSCHYVLIANFFWNVLPVLSRA